MGGREGLSCALLDEARRADKIFAETYTNSEGESAVSYVESIAAKKAVLLKRRDLEEEGGKIILEAARVGEVLFLVPGDPFVFTTHSYLRKEALEAGIGVRVIHGLSIYSVAVSASGLDPYRFGPPVTLVYPDEEHGYFPEAAYDVVHENLSRDLHTLLLMDVKAEEGQIMNFEEAFNVMTELERRRMMGVFAAGRGIVLLSALGSSKEKVLWAHIGDKLADELPPPRSLVVPASLRFYEGFESARQKQ